MINWCCSCCLYLALLTDEFCWFVWPLVDESLKGLLHCVDESLAPCKTALCNIVHFVLKVQQVLHHVLVFFWSTHYLSTKGLREETVPTKVHMCLIKSWVVFILEEDYTFI